MTGRSLSSPTVPAPPSASPKSSRAPAWPPGWSRRSEPWTPASCTSPAPAWDAVSSCPTLGWRSSPRPTSRALRRSPVARPGHAADALQAPQPGRPAPAPPRDHVVHEQHGVGKFVEMMQRTVQGATREYLVIEYAPSKRGHPGDRLFVPTDQLDQVTRYVGGEQPTLNKLGGSDWQAASPAPNGTSSRSPPSSSSSTARGWRRPGIPSPRHPVAARARGRLRLHRDARPALHDRRGQGGHGAQRAHGPPRLR